MQRRQLLRTLGGTAALGLLPLDFRAAWASLAEHGRAEPGFSPAQMAVVSAIADVLIPRTSTPGALDVQVPAFVEKVVSESWFERDRTSFTTGLDALGTRMGSATGASLAARIQALEANDDRRAEPARTYWRLKSLVVHGYFTSEAVMKEVLHVQIMPGRFDGSAPMPASRAKNGRSEASGDA